MTASKIFLYLCLSFIFGIFVGSLVSFSLPILLGFLIFGVLLISVFWPKDKLGTDQAKKKICVAGFCIIFLTIGIWRYDDAKLANNHGELAKFNDSGQKIEMAALIIDQPERGEKVQRFTIMAENFSNSKILITTNLYPGYKYGDRLKITGKLETPSFNENYKEYLAKDGIYSVSGWPKIEKTGSGFGNPVMAVLYSFKDKFEQTTRKFVSPPQQGLLEALIFGNEDNISKDWQNKINNVGVRHIAAVSGMNITIISSLILSFALGLGLWRKQAFYVSIILIILYILMIGAPASAVRAGILGGLFMLGQHLGRFSAASRAIIFAAAFMLLLNPLLLRVDVGFQLSFLAMLGIIYLQPVFGALFKKLPNPKVFPLGTALASTLSAQVLTLPILIYNFGYVSLVSPITNILIVPIIAPLTVLIFIFGGLAMIFLPLGFIFSWLAWVGLTYIVFIIDIFSKLSFVAINIKEISLILVLAYYMVAVLFIFWWQRKEKGWLLNY